MQTKVEGMKKPSVIFLLEKSMRDTVRKDALLVTFHVFSFLRFTEFIHNRFCRLTLTNMENRGLIISYRTVIQNFLKSGC